MNKTNKVIFSLLSLVLLSFLPLSSTGQNSTSEKPADKPAPQAEQPSTSSSQSTEEAEAMAQLDEQLKKVDAAIAEGLKQAAEKYKSAISSEVLLKTLPSQEEVLKNKDQISFKEYGGLAEIYLFDEKLKEAEAIYSWLSNNCDTVLGTDDPTAGLLDSDFALYYYAKGDYAKALPLFHLAISSLEKYLPNQPEKVHNNLISAYAGMAEIDWKTGKKEESIDYIRKISELHAHKPGASSP